MKNFYKVQYAVGMSEPWGKIPHDFDEKLNECYEDCFDLGWFETDAEAFARLEEIQYKADKKASAVLAKIQKKQGYLPTDDFGHVVYGNLGDGGVRYADNLYKTDFEKGEFVRVFEGEE